MLTRHSLSDILSDILPPLSDLEKYRLKLICSESYQAAGYFEYIRTSDTTCSFKVVCLDGFEDLGDRLEVLNTLETAMADGIYDPVLTGYYFIHSAEDGYTYSVYFTEYHK